MSILCPSWPVFHALARSVRVPRELLADAEHAGVGVHVAPAQPERLADAKPGVGEELEQRAARAGVLQELGEVRALQDADVLDPPPRLLAWLQLRDRVHAHPAAPHGIAEDLVQGD